MERLSCSCCSSIAIVHAGRPDLSAAPQHAGTGTSGRLDHSADGAGGEESAGRRPEGASQTGKELFEKNCQKCHGPGGKGDGPDADPDQQQDMDLTVARRAARNPDGVVFYKIWNGRAEAEDAGRRRTT